MGRKNKGEPFRSIGVANHTYMKRKGGRKKEFREKKKIGQKEKIGSKSKTKMKQTSSTHQERD